MDTLALRTIAPQPVSEQPAFTDQRATYFDYAQEYDEKQQGAAWVSKELGALIAFAPEEIHRTGLHVLDAGTGTGELLKNVALETLRQHPQLPLTLTGKENSGEDVVKTVENFAAVFAQHPDLQLNLHNHPYAAAPFGIAPPADSKKPHAHKWVVLSGTTRDEIAAEFKALESFFLENWRYIENSKRDPAQHVAVSIRHKNSQRPEARFEGHDAVIASHTTRLQATLPFKAEKVFTPLAEATRKATPTRPGGALLIFQAAGDELAERFVNDVLPSPAPRFPHDGATILAAVESELAKKGHAFTYDASGSFLARPRRPFGQEDLHDKRALAQIARFAGYVAQVDDNAVADVIARNDHITPILKGLLRQGGQPEFRTHVLKIARADGPR